MRWTYNRIQEYVRRVRGAVLKKGCRKCGRLALSLELAGTPSLTRLARDGYGLERIMEAGRSRGWFCRSCAKGINTKQAATRLEGWKKEKKQLKSLIGPVSKRDWSEDDKWDYIYDEAAGVGSPITKAQEVFEAAELEAALKVLRETS